MPPKHPISMDDLAASLGVSRMTVSRALRNHPEVSETTRARILAEAKRRGYIPDARMSELMARVRSGRNAAFTGTIGWMAGIRTRGDQPQHSAGNREHRIGAERRAESLGYKIDTFMYPFDGSEDQPLRRHLRARGICGLVVYPPEGTDFHLSFDFSGFVPVCVGTNIRSPKMHRVLGNHRHASRLALDTLARRGYRRPGLALFRVTDVNNDHEWLPGFLAYQQFLPKRDRVPIHFWDGFGRASAEAASAWFERYRPDVVLATDHMMAIWLRDAGYRIGVDLGYINLCVRPTDHVQTGIRDEPEHTGSLIIETIVAQMHRNERGIPERAEECLIESTWTDAGDLPDRSALARPTPRARSRS